MKFGSPLTPGPDITNPAGIILPPQVWPATSQLPGPTNADAVDVSAYNNLIVGLSPGGGTWDFYFFYSDQQGNNTISNPWYPAGAGTPSLVMANLGLITFTYALPVLGPRFHMIASGGAGAQPTLEGLWGTNVPMRWPTLHSLASAGSVIASNTTAFAANSAGNVALPAYTGPAILATRAVGGGVENTYLATLANPQIPLGAASVGDNRNSPFTRSTDLWVPPQPCQITIENGALAQTISVALVAA